MTTLYEGAFAKINLTLDVLGKRADGYHELKTVMQALSVQDDIEIDVGTGKPWTLVCDTEGMPCDERNLAWKAAKLFQEASGKDLGGIEIRIVKRIPSQAGMGGGSADAAAVLRALNRHFEEIFSMEALADLGGRIGSDVPFCVVGGTCMCEGRGEILRKLPDLPDCHVVICKPEFGVSTPYLYNKVDSVEIPSHPDNDAMEQALADGDLAKVCENVYNVFDPLVAQEHPEVNEIKSVMDSLGALASQMTGSGSVVFAITQSEECAKSICEALKDNYPGVFVCKPV